MRYFSSTKYIVALFALSLLFAMPFALKKTINISSAKNRNELFNERLLAFNSVSKVVHFLDYTNQVKKKTSFDTSAYVNSASDFIKQRFSFGLANYSYADNWIAKLCGDLFWEHFSAIVNPNDILKYDAGICSQQTIVFLEILKQKKINVRTVGMGNQQVGPGHFLCEVFYNNEWHMYDVTKEPNWHLISQKHFDIAYYIKHQDLFYKIYKNKMDALKLGLNLNQISYGNTNEFPAKNMLFFHKTTYVISIFTPIIFLFLAFFALYKKRKFKT